MCITLAAMLNFQVYDVKFELYYCWYLGFHLSPLWAVNDPVRLSVGTHPFFRQLLAMLYLITSAIKKLYGAQKVYPIGKDANVVTHPGSRKKKALCFL
jgi:hypothetical protein